MSEAPTELVLNLKQRTREASARISSEEEVRKQEVATKKEIDESVWVEELYKKLVPISIDLADKGQNWMFVGATTVHNLMLVEHGATKDPLDYVLKGRAALLRDFLVAEGFGFRLDLWSRKDREDYRNRADHKLLLEFSPRIKQDWDNDCAGLYLIATW